MAMTPNPPAAAARPPRGWGRPRVLLNPLAVLLRQRYGSRAQLARASGLGYQMLRTYTDGLWTADRPPPAHVLAGLARAVPPDELHAAVRAALADRADQAQPGPALTWGQRVVLEGLRGFDDARLVAAAPHIHELVVRLDTDKNEDLAGAGREDEPPRHAPA